MGYLSAVARTGEAPRAAAPAPSWRLTGPTPDAEAGETHRARDVEGTEDTAGTPTDDRWVRDETEVQAVAGESEAAPVETVADHPRLRPPRHSRMPLSEATEIVLSKPIDAPGEVAPPTDEGVPTVSPPDSETPTEPELAATVRPPQPTPGETPEQPRVQATDRPRPTSTDGPRRIAELRVPADAYPGDLVHSSPTVIRSWLTEHSEIVTSEHDETSGGVTVERLIFEQPPPGPPESEPRERPQPRGFADYDSIRKR